jgi:hypothetical protein
MNRYCFDFRGAYLGRLDEYGLFFDAEGTMRARVSNAGIYGLDGQCLGRVDAQGSLYANDGTCWGYVRNWH